MIGVRIFFFFSLKLFYYFLFDFQFFSQIIIFVGFTTELRQIKPRSAGPTELVNFMGAPKFASSTQIEHIKIGPFICDRIGLDDVDYIVWDANSLFNCRVAPEMEAGYYNSSFKVKERGFSRNLPSFPALSPSGQLYEFKCYPLVNNVSSNLGSPNGQVITISGNGFSPMKENVKVVAGDYPCNVLDSDLYQITCEVQSQKMNQTVFTKGPGVEKRVFNMTANTGIMDLRSGKFQASYWSQNLTAPLISYSIAAEIDRLPVDARSIFFLIIYIISSSFFLFLF